MRTEAKSTPSETTPSSPVLQKSIEKSNVTALFEKVVDKDPSSIVDPHERRALCNMLSSIFGVPVANNRKLLHGLLKEHGVDKRREESPLNDLLSMPRPTEDNFTLEPMRQYLINNGLKEKYRDSPLYDVLFPETPREDESSLAGQRRYTIALVREIGRRQIVTGKNVAEGIDGEKTKEFLKEISLIDPSVATLWGVHFTLWIGAVLKSGTEKHAEAFLDDSESMKIVGSCLMTEMGHGSNVQGLQTTAEFDVTTGEFVLDSPTLTSLKWWPGGLAENSTHGVVFAQLIFEGKCLGVHSFAIRYRGDDGKNLPGIKTGYLGEKIGLNGIDNGWCKFEKMRVPLDSLLNRRGWIEKKGEKYEYHFDEKSVRSPEKIYIKEMEQYVRGRQTICYSSSLLQQLAAFIFDLYPPSSMPSEMHHHYLTDMLSCAYMHKFAESIIEGPFGDDHIRASVMKSILSGMGGNRLDQLKFLYGGNLHNRRVAQILFGIRSSQIATEIYEGENNMLLLLGSNYILNKEIRNNSQRWEEEVCVFEPENPETLNKVPSEQRPILLLKWEIFHLFCQIRDHMMKVIGEGKNPQEEFMTGAGPGQRDAVQACWLWGQVLILENALQKISEIKKSNPDHAQELKALYMIYANNVCKRGHKPFSSSEIYKAREFLKGPTYEKHRTHQLCAKLLVPLEWVDAILTPPGRSVSYTDSSREQQARL